MKTTNEITDIRKEAKESYCSAIKSNSREEIIEVIRNLEGIRHRILNSKYLACSEGASDTVYMLDDFVRVLTIHHYILGKY